MNVLIVYAYPNHEGLNYAIKEAVVKGISAKNQVQMIDLYAEQFDPVLTFDSKHKRRYLAQNPETENYREVINWAEQLVFIYPIWWSSMPAILKGFIDRVFAKDFAYRYQGIRPIGLLQGKQAWIINTHDSPTLYARFIQKDYGRILDKQILKMCGIKTSKHTSLAYVRGADSAKINKFLNKISTIANKL